MTEATIRMLENLLTAVDREQGTNRTLRKELFAIQRETDAHEKMLEELKEDITGTLDAVRVFETIRADSKKCPVCNEASSFTTDANGIKLGTVWFDAKGREHTCQGPGGPR